MPSIRAGEKTAPSGELFVERGDDGIWRYGGTSIAAVGAKDRTLGDVLQVRQLGISGNLPEAAVFSLSEIIANPRLTWVLQNGTRLRGGEEDLFSVPWPIWEDHATDPVDVWLPERDARGLDQRLATTEREVRFLREAFEAATARRTQLTLLGSELGMTRRQTAEMLGLSAGRVQQLHEEIDDQHVALVRQTVSDARLLLKGVEAEVHPDELVLPRGWTREKLSDVLAHLEDWGLLEAVEGRDELRLTDAGRQAISSRTAKVRSRTSRAEVHSGR